MEGTFSNRAVDRAQKGLSDGRDRSLLLELVNGVLRRRLRLDAELAAYLDRPLGRLSPPVRNALRLGLYQLRFLDRVPSFAAVNETVNATKAVARPQAASLVNAVLRRAVDGPPFAPPDFSSDPAGHLSVSESHPRWLVERWLGRWPAAEVRRLLEANNRRPEVTLRVNRLRAAPADLSARLTGAGIEVRPGKYLEEFLCLSQAGPVDSLPGFLDGWFQVQDEGAGLVSRLLGPKPGQIVVDLCAAPGGKAAYLAELMADKGSVLAADINRDRLKLVAGNAARLGLGSIRPVAADGRRPAIRFADGVLADVPCSGTGVLARRPDLRWRVEIADLERLSHLQSELLAGGARMLRPGGVLVYSTCSLEPEENQAVVARFLAENPEFELESLDGLAPAQTLRDGKYLFVTPHEHGMDGAFGARMVRRR